MGKKSAQTQTSNKVNTLHKAGFYAFSGLIAKAALNQGDRLRVLSQSSDAVYGGIFEKSVLRTYQKARSHMTYRQFTSGNFTNLGFSLPLTIARFAIFDQALDLLEVQKDRDDTNKFLAKSLAAGGLAGILPTFLLYPRELVRTQQTVFGESFREVVSAVRRQEGVRGLYRGFFSSLFGSFIYRAAYFGGFHYAKHEHFDNFPKMPLKEKFLVVYGISFGAALLSYPIDVIRRRMAV